MRFHAGFLVASFFVFVSSNVVAAVSPVCSSEMAANIPPRAANAMTGSQFARYVSSMPAQAREQAIRQQLLSGNIPAFLRRLKPVTLKLHPSDGKAIVATVCVTPDYLAIGSNKDYLRIPANLYTAHVVADAFGFVLPTTRIVDAIYHQAAYHLQPRPLPAGPQMRSTEYYVTHNRLVQEELPSSYAGGLVAGDKKDVVLTNRRIGKPNRIAIYGWHRLNGRPIQPLSTVHGVRYADYSHGIRLVSDTVWVNGDPRSIINVLENPKLATVLSSEGPIDADRALKAAAPTLSASTETSRTRF